jgi:hypothetical protein
VKARPEPVAHQDRPRRRQRTLGSLPLAALAILACSCGSAVASGDRRAAKGEKLIAQTATARLYGIGDPAGTREVRYFICGRSTGHR